MRRVGFFIDIKHFNIKKILLLYTLPYKESK